MKRWRVPAALAGLFCATACGSPTVPLDLRFPSQTTFLVTRTVRVDVVALDSASLGRCPELLAARTLDATLSVDDLAPCDVRRGLDLPDPGPGAHAFIVRARAASNAVILEGCTVAEAYPGAAPIEVTLYPTGDYATAAAAMPPPPGATVDSICAGTAP